MPRGVTHDPYRSEAAKPPKKTGSTNGETRGLFKKQAKVKKAFDKGYRTT